MTLPEASRRADAYCQPPGLYFTAVMFRAASVVSRLPRGPGATQLQKGAAMNYRAIIIGLGLLIFLAAMIPYAYKTRCSSPSECPTTAPY